MRILEEDWEQDLMKRGYRKVEGTYYIKDDQMVAIHDDKNKFTKFYALQWTVADRR